MVMNKQEERQRRKQLNQRYHHHWNNERISKVPEEFKSPKLTLAALMGCWYWGDVKLNMMMFKILAALDLRHAKDKWKNLIGNESDYELG